MDVKLVLGLITGILLVTSMCFKDVRKIKLTILAYSLFDMGVSIWLGAWPLLAMYLMKILLVSEYLTHNPVSHWIKKAIPVASVGIVIWALSGFILNGFDWVNIVGWAHTGIALTAIAANTERRIKLLTMLACMIGFYYGFLIDYWPMSAIRVVLFGVTAYTLFKVKPK